MFQAYPNCEMFASANFYAKLVQISHVVACQSSKICVFTHD